MDQIPSPMVERAISVYEDLQATLLTEITDPGKPRVQEWLSIDIGSYAGGPMFCPVPNDVLDKVSLHLPSREIPSSPWLHITVDTSLPLHPEVTVVVSVNLNVGRTIDPERLKESVPQIPIGSPEPIVDWISAIV